MHRFILKQHSLAILCCCCCCCCCRCRCYHCCVFCVFFVSFRILALEKLGAVFNQQSVPLQFTPRQFVIDSVSNNIVVVESDHNALTDQTKQERKEQMAAVRACTLLMICGCVGVCVCVFVSGWMCVRLCVCPTADSVVCLWTWMNCLVSHCVF